MEKSCKEILDNFVTEVFEYLYCGPILATHIYVDRGEEIQDFKYLKKRWDLVDKPISGSFPDLEGINDPRKLSETLSSLKNDLVALSIVGILVDYGYLTKSGDIVKQDWCNYGDKTDFEKDKKSLKRIVDSTKNEKLKKILGNILKRFDGLNKIS